MNLCRQLVQCWKNIHLQEEYCRNSNQVNVIQFNESNNGSSGELDECANTGLNLIVQLEKKNHQHETQLIECLDKRNREHNATQLDDQQVI